jgi:hypothetical protein
MKVWFITTVLKQRAIMVVLSTGKQHVRKLKYTDGGKAYVTISDGVIGFLDNVNQNEGEFRKGISSDTLLRWFNVS